jgi:hypothetical protein
VTWRRADMKDIVYIALTCAFFVLAWLYVRGCERV